MRALTTVLLLAAVATPAGQEQPTTFRSGTQVVEVDVRVFDENGRFVPELTARDFTLSEDGVAHTIQSVHLVTGGALSSPTGGSGPALVSSESTRAARQTWLFLFDTEHLSPAGLTRTRDAVRTFVQERFRDGDMAGVIVGGRMADNRISGVKEEIDRAIASVAVHGDPRSRQLELRTWPRLMDEYEAQRIVDNDREAMDVAVRRACADDPSACRMVRPDAEVGEKAERVVTAARVAAQQTIDTVAALCSGLARIPGPKTVVMLSDGFVVQGVESQLRQAIGQAARAGARFYTIDARGLNRGPGTSTLDLATIDDPAVGTRFDTQADGTTSLGVDTGGLAIRNENNISRALDEIDRDSGNYYILVYSPSNTAFDGRYRRIEIGVNRIGVKVRARRGYLALPPARMLVPTAALTSPAGPAPVQPELTAPADSPAKPAGLAATTPPVLEAPPAVVKPPPPPESPAANAARTRVSAGALVMDLARESGHAPPEAGLDTEGWAAYERGDVKAAARLLGEAAARPDARPWVVYASGLACLADGRPADAARAWERVRAAVPQFEPIYFDLADAYLQMEDEGKAVSVLRAAQQRWPADSEIHNALGVAQVKRGALDDAIASFQKAIASSPSESLGYFNLARAFHIRYFKSHRYNTLLKKWTGNDRDREAASANFQKYIEMGGPYADQARAALSALSWK
jgi:VWFA-related protein